MYDFVRERFNWLRDNLTAGDAVLQMFYKTFHDELLDNGFEPFVFVRSDAVSGVISNAIVRRSSTDVFGAAVVRHRDSHWCYHAPRLIELPNFLDRVLLVRRFEVRDVITFGMTAEVTLENANRETFDASIFFNVISKFAEAGLAVQHFVQVCRPTVPLQAVCRKALSDWRTALTEGDHEDAFLTAHILAAELRTRGYLPAVFVDCGPESRFITANSAYFDRDLNFLLTGQTEDKFHLVKQGTQIVGNNALQHGFDFVFTAYNPFRETEKTVNHTYELPPSRAMTFEGFLDRYIYLI